jgi:hypothetical protein
MKLDVIIQFIKRKYKHEFWKRKNITPCLDFGFGILDFKKGDNNVVGIKQIFF